MFFEYLKNFTDYKLFSLTHVLYFVFAIAAVVGLTLLLRNRSAKTQRIVSIFVACFVLFLHTATQVWRVASFAQGRAAGIIDQVAYLVMPNELLPFQLCSMLCLLIPFCVTLNKQWMYNAIAPICVLAGFLFFLFPDGIINRYPPLSFRVLESMLAHTGILFYGVYLFASKKVVFKLANMKHVFPVAAGMFLLGMVMNLILLQSDPNVDFFFMVKGFGLGLPPVVNGLVLVLVGTAAIFIIFAVCQLCYKLSANKKKELSANVE